MTQALSYEVSFGRSDFEEDRVIIGLLLPVCLERILNEFEKGIFQGQGFILRRNPILESLTEDVCLIIQKIDI